jgi:uncharacterized protein
VSRKVREPTGSAGRPPLGSASFSFLDSISSVPKEAEGRTGKPAERRLKPERPRDRLGRPLPWTAENELTLEDYDSLSLEENHRLGIEHFNAGRYFPAHEAWETAWKKARNTDDAEFFKGLSQLGAGYVHLFRGNRHGAITLLRRGAGRVGRYPSGHHGIDPEAVRKRAEADADRIARDEITPGEGARLDPPRV